MRSAEERRAFVREHTALEAVPLVPDLRLHLATEVTPLWTVSQAWLERLDVPPPFWAFAWAGGQAVARHVLDHPELVRGARVLDFASGSGLVALAALRAGAASAIAVDVDALACAAAELNAEANGLELTVRCEDVVGSDLEDLDVVLAGDVFYDREAAARFEPWLRRLARGGKRVLVGDPGRSYLPGGLEELGAYDVPTSEDLEGVRTKRGRALAVRG